MDVVLKQFKSKIAKIEIEISDLTKNLEFTQAEGENQTVTVKPRFRNVRNAIRRSRTTFQLPGRLAVVQTTSASVVWRKSKDKKNANKFDPGDSNLIKQASITIHEL